MSWLVTSLAANVCIVVLEYFHRTSSLGVWNVVRIIPFVIACQALIWATWRNGPSVMLVWCVFTFGNTILRVLNTHYLLGEPMSARVWIAVGLMSAGALVMNWR